MPPFKLTRFDEDLTTTLLLGWIQIMITKYNRIINTSNHPHYRPQRNIITDKKQQQRDEIRHGRNHIVRVCNFTKIYRYYVYLIVRDSLNRQLSCI